MFRVQNYYSTVVVAGFRLCTKISIPQYLFIKFGTPGIIIISIYLGFIAQEVLYIVDLIAKYGAACDIYSMGLIFHMM